MISSPYAPGNSPSLQPVSEFLERNSGDACSALSVVGAIGLVASRRRPQFERPSEAIILASMGAAVLDASYQSINVAQGDEKRGAQTLRGGAEENRQSNIGTIAYAATGVLPAASIHALDSLRHRPSKRELAQLAFFAVNSGLMGYEIMHRAPKMVDGKETASGYGSFAAAMGAFVVAGRALR